MTRGFELWVDITKKNAVIAWAGTCSYHVRWPGRERRDDKVWQGLAIFTKEEERAEAIFLFS